MACDICISHLVMVMKTLSSLNLHAYVCTFSKNCQGTNKRLPCHSPRHSLRLLVTPTSQPPSWWGRSSPWGATWTLSRWSSTLISAQEFVFSGWANSWCLMLSLPVSVIVFVSYLWRDLTDSINALVFHILLSSLSLTLSLLLEFKFLVYGRVKIRLQSSQLQRWWFFFFYLWN